jgi:hypothetical protein
MDDILAKHLAKKLLFKEKKKTVVKENTVKEGFYKYKLIDDKYYVNFGSNLIVSEKIGTWKNKDVVIINKNKYVVLENSNTVIPLNHLSEEEFEENFVKDKTVRKKKTNFAQNPTFLQSSKKEPVSKEPVSKIPSIKKEEPIEEEEPTIRKIKETPVVSKQEEETSTEKYIEDIKNSQNSEKVEEDAEEDADTKSFFDLLEKKKDDPRVKKFFNYHADHMKKEFNQIIEKVKTTQFARAMESGGGTNAVQYANGGTMNGNLTVTEQIIGDVVTDTLGRQLVHKKTFNIVGNGSDNEFTFTHNFNTKDILINVYDSTNYALVTISSVNIDLNNTRITFPNILTVGENYRVILIA